MITRSKKRERNKGNKGNNNRNTKKQKSNNEIVVNENVMNENVMNENISNEFFTDTNVNLLLTNSLGIDVKNITTNLENYLNISDTNASLNGVKKYVSTYLIDAFSVLVESYKDKKLTRGHKPVTSDECFKIMQYITETIRTGDLFENMYAMKGSAAYSAFCRSFFYKDEGKNVRWRKILENQRPTLQCTGVGAIKEKCWICTKPLGQLKQQCEHILPISDALFHLNLYQHKGTYNNMSNKNKEILTLEYEWAHKCCNMWKSNTKYIKKEEAEYIINQDGINKTIFKIKNGLASYQCNEVFNSNEVVSSDFYTGMSTNIRTRVQPIITHINDTISAINSTNGINAMIVYEYLIMIRFFSRIPGNLMLRAFLKNVRVAERVSQRLLDRRGVISPTTGGSRKCRKGRKV